MTDTQTLLMDLITHASSAEPMEFELVCSLHEYFTIRQRRRALKSVLKLLKASQKNLFNSYCVEVEHGTASTSKLITCVVLDTTIAFYENEYCTIDTMIGEYEIYLITGNLFDFVLYGGRPEHKLFDHRRFFDGDVVD